jgi:hypothetical protein
MERQHRYITESFLASPARTAPGVFPDRLEAWREGPGGMPELLAIGQFGALFVEIPASITFDTGDLYQLRLQARNSQGTSDSGPKQTWVAVQESGRQP